MHSGSLFPASSAVKAHCICFSLPIDRSLLCLQNPIPSLLSSHRSISPLPSKLKIKASLCRQNSKLKLLSSHRSISPMSSKPDSVAPPLHAPNPKHSRFVPGKLLIRTLSTSSLFFLLPESQHLVQEGK